MKGQEHAGRFSVKKSIENILFGSKWMLIPFYLGLIIAQAVYFYWYTLDVIHMLSEAPTISKEDGMLIVLELVDIVMIANLIKMIISGSYNSFITKDHAENAEKASSGLLKVKMATSLVGVSSIHLLQSFINADKISAETINKQIYIHAIFLAGAIILALIDYLHIKAEAIEESMHHKKSVPHDNENH